jgi:CRP/FNR family cyclic AMP-dependent transcriptional regulator
MDSRLEALRGLPLFADLDDRSLEAISVLAREITVPAGEVLMLEGERGSEFYVIVEGTIHIEHGDRTVRSMTAGGFLGEIALLEHRPRTATATCVTDCRLLAIQQHEFDRLVDRFPSIYRRVKAAIVRRAAGLGGDPIA